MTAGNASGINDGAAALVIMDGGRGACARLDAAGAHRFLGDSRGRSGAHGLGPDSRTRKALEKAGWKVKDLDLVEANEAFAAQALAVNKDLGWTRPSSTSMAAPSRSVIRSALRARAFS